MAVVLCVGLLPSNAFAIANDVAIDDATNAIEGAVDKEPSQDDDVDDASASVGEEPSDEEVTDASEDGIGPSEEASPAPGPLDEAHPGLVEEPAPQADDASSGRVSITQTEDQKARGAFSVTVAGLSSSDMSMVEAAVWSDARGQDDLAWYSLVQWQGVWTRELPCVAANRDPGLYHCHIYVTDAEGASACIATASSQVALLEADVSASVNPDQTWFSVRASGGYAQAAPVVQFAVWSDAGGQDDLRWYSAVLRNGVWTNDIPVSLHATAGTYQVHVYALVGGKRYFSGGATFGIKAPTGKVSFVSSQTNGYTIRVTDVSAPSGITSVSAGAWALAGGQDDLAWHEGEKQGDAWLITVSASHHLGQDGIYENHVYVTCDNGVRAMIGACRTDNVKTVICPFVSGSMGSGKRTLGIKSPPSADHMSYAVWSEEGGQDDLVWYDLNYRSPDTWAVDIDCYELKHAGTVVAHLYNPAGFVAAISFEVSEDDILPAPYRDMDARVSGMYSPTNWLLSVDTHNCFVGVYHWENGAWNNWYRLACSPGKPSTPTVKGVFRVQSKGYSFGSGYTCYYWTQFYGDYLFHSILYDQGTFNVQDGRLGQQLSHGCVRMDIWDAKWIQDVIPAGTTVYIY